jgi:hypothetical protein
VTAPPKPEKKKELPDSASGMELGSIDVREIIESYQNEITELKLYKEKLQPERKEPQFNVTRIEVVVGLSDKYDDVYMAQFKQWIVKRIQYDYGRNALATVNKQKSAPIVEIPKKPLEPLTWREFIPYLGYALLGLAFILAAWLLGRGLTKLGQGAKNFVIEHKNPFSLEHSQNQKLESKTELKHLLEDNRVSPSTEGDADEHLKEKSVGQSAQEDELVGKIIYLCLELNRGVNELVRIWLDNGNDGYLKTAVLIDTIVTLKEKVSAETSAASINLKANQSAETSAAIARLSIPLDDDLTTSYGVNLSEAYSQAAQMQVDEKKQYLDKIYWDLLQLRTLGVKNMRKPFDYLQAMSDVDFNEAMKFQADEAKALALMFGDQTKRKNYFSSIQGDEKEKIVQIMIGLSQISKKQIWDFDAAVKVKLISSSLNLSENFVNLLPRTMEMLGSLGAVDEIKMLRKVCTTLPDQGTAIKQQHATLAFIDEWHEPYVTRLVKIASSSELVNLIHVIPEARESVLIVCPDKVRMMVIDDLNLKPSDPQTVEKNMYELRRKWKNICTTQNINISLVVNPFGRTPLIKEVA